MPSYMMLSCDLLVVNFVSDSVIFLELYATQCLYRVVCFGFGLAYQIRRLIYPVVV
jgi:hypothetical protein